MVLWLILRSTDTYQNLANITVPEARQLFIKPFDKSSLILKKLLRSKSGITPTNNGEMIIITILNNEEEEDMSN